MLYCFHRLWESKDVRVIRAQLEGTNAEPGQVAAADVARIILGLERAIARAAYLVLGKSRRGTGRHSHAIESAARLRFVGVERGSFVELLALPEVAEPSDDELPIPIADLSSQAFDRILETISNDGGETDTELAAAIAQMASELGIGDRNTSIILADNSLELTGSTPRHATIDAAVRERMQRLSTPQSTSKDQTLVGVLVEADFEAYKARLRLVDGRAVTVRFSAELANDIQEALRSRAGFEGVVRYHRTTSQAASVEVSAVVRGMQLTLDADSFWNADTFADLQAAQGKSGRVDPSDLASRLH
jgi:hypothetical protein